MTTRRLTMSDAAGWLALLALAGVVFSHTAVRLFDRWWNDPTYAHGLLVPFVSAFFLWENLRNRPDSAGSGSLYGVPALLAALALFFAGRLGNMLFVEALALIGVLASLALLVEGRVFFAAAALPLAYLVFMCPLPSGLYDLVSAQLRLFASAVSTVLLQLMGVPATSSGNIIQIPQATLSVEDACSGIRSLFGIVATATAFAFVVRGGIARKLFLVLSSAPIAVAANILRVTGTGLLHNRGYSSLAEGFYHQVEGWMFYIIALVALFVEYRILLAVFPLASPGDGPPADGKPGEVSA